MSRESLSRNADRLARSLADRDRRRSESKVIPHERNASPAEVAAYRVLFGDVLLMTLHGLGRRDPGGLALARSRATFDTLSAARDLSPEQAEEARVRVTEAVAESLRIPLLRSGFGAGNEEVAA